MLTGRYVNPYNNIFTGTNRFTKPVTFESDVTINGDLVVDGTYTITGDVEMDTVDISDVATINALVLENMENQVLGTNADGEVGGISFGALMDFNTTTHTLNGVLTPSFTSVTAGTFTRSGSTNALQYSNASSQLSDVTLDGTLDLTAGTLKVVPEFSTGTIDDLTSDTLTINDYILGGTTPSGVGWSAYDLADGGLHINGAGVALDDRLSGTIIMSGTYDVGYGHKILFMNDGGSQGGDDFAYLSATTRGGNWNIDNSASAYENAEMELCLGNDMLSTGYHPDAMGISGSGYIILNAPKQWNFGMSQTYPPLSIFVNPHGTAGAKWGDRGTGTAADNSAGDVIGGQQWGQHNYITTSRHKIQAVAETIGYCKKTPVLQTDVVGRLVTRVGIDDASETLCDAIDIDGDAESIIFGSTFNHRVNSTASASSRTDTTAAHYVAGDSAVANDIYCDNLYANSATVTTVTSSTPCGQVSYGSDELQTYSSGDQTINLSFDTDDVNVGSCVSSHSLYYPSDGVYRVTAHLTLEDPNDHVASSSSRMMVTTQTTGSNIEYRTVQMSNHELNNVIMREAHISFLVNVVHGGSSTGTLQTILSYKATFLSSGTGAAGDIQFNAETTYLSIDKVS